MTDPALLVARPRVMTINAVVWTIVLCGMSLVGWWALPPQIRALFTGPQVATLIFFVLVIVGFMFSLTLSSVRADDEGLRIRNGYRVHWLPWRDVIGIRFAPGDAWAFAQLADDEKLAMMGVMRVDGKRAVAYVERLRELQRASR